MEIALCVWKTKEPESKRVRRGLEIHHGYLCQTLQLRLEAA